MRLTQGDISEIHQIADALQDRMKHLSERINLLDKSTTVGLQELSVVVSRLRHYAGSVERDKNGVLTYDKKTEDYIIVDKVKI